MFTISKQFAFEASHQLDHLPPEHKCSRNHGHSYRVIVELQSYELNKRGFVVDYGDLSPLRDYINENLDHRFLNDVLPFQTTAENIAAHLYDWCAERWRQVSRVGVSETQNTWAWFGPPFVFKSVNFEFPASCDDLEPERK